MPWEAAQTRASERASEQTSDGVAADCGRPEEGGEHPSASQAAPGRRGHGLEVVHHDDAPKVLAIVEVVECGLRVLQAIIVRDQLVQHQGTLLVQLEEHGDLHRRHAGAHEGADEVLLQADDLQGADRQGVLRLRNAHHDRSPSCANEIVCLLGRLRIADDLEAVIRPSRGQLTDRLDHIRHLLGVHRVGGAEALRGLELGGRRVHGDDLPRAADPATLDGVEAHPATAHDATGRAWVDLGAVHCRPNASCHSTAHQGALRQGNVLAHLDDGGLVDHHVLRHAPQARLRHHRLAALVKDAADGEGGGPVGADRRLASAAVQAPAARHDQREHGPIAHLNGTWHRGDALANGLHDACALVAEDHGQRRG
mmetsp:Transcript_114751/g.357374  ORF Transcript_114751/g.357374 Transcript_114751/m.357374 type:complete len:368 (-) Transcript_114751:226-1329(-)